MTNSAGPEFVLGGFRGYPTGAGMSEKSTHGYCWSSTAGSSATLAYELRLVSSGSVYLVYSEYKYFGYPLRYLAEVGPTRFIFTSPPLLLPEKEKQSCSLHPHHLPTTH